MADPTRVGIVGAAATPGGQWLGGRPQWFDTTYEDMDVGALTKPQRPLGGRHRGHLDSITTSVYTPVTADVTYFLRVTAAYTDALRNKSLVAVSTNSVLAAPAVNNPPAFTETSPTRSIAENARANDMVGGRVVATDPDPNDTVRYEFEPPESDLFTIDGSSGQIRVKAQGVLD